MSLGRNDNGEFIRRGTPKIVVFLAVLLFLAAAVGLNAFSIVPAGHTGVRVTMGSVSEVPLTAGLHFKLPFLQVIEIMDNRVLRVDIDSSSASRDLQMIQATVSLNYRVDRASSPSLFKNIGKEFENRIVRPTIQECIKAVTAQYTAEELITKRQDVSNQIKNLIAEKIESHGLRTELFNIINFDFSEEFNIAIEAKQTAQQQALKAEQDLVRIKVEAEQRIAEAQAVAEAYRLQSQELTENMIKAKWIEKWDGRLPQVQGGESSSMIIDMRD
jgi:regulator of protease activity HflC (stomatin/prohibitin superfamily)